MADMTQKAYEAASMAAHKIARSIVESLCDAIKEGEVTDEEGLSERMREECDNACIYTADCYALCWGLREASEDAISDFGAQTMSDAITKQAYANLREYVERAKDWDGLMEDAKEDLRDTDQSEE
jgi:hypothetical protein